MNLIEIDQIAWELTAGLTASKNDEPMKGKLRDLLTHLSAGRELEDFKTVVDSYRPPARKSENVDETKRKKLRDFYHDFVHRTEGMEQKERIQTLRYVLWNIEFYEKGSIDSLKTGIMAEDIQMTDNIKSMIERKENETAESGEKKYHGHKAQGYDKRR